MSNLHCKIPDALERKLARAAKQRQVPKSAIVREAIAKELRNPITRPLRAGEQKSFVSAYDLMKDGIGCFDSGLGDLSTNKKYLEGMGREKFRR